MDEHLKSHKVAKERIAKNSLEYYNNYVANYTESRGYIYKILRIFQMIPHNPSYVLDIGCSHGAVLTYATKVFKPKIAVGVDISSKALRMGKKHKQINFIRASATHLPFRKGFFDFVLCANLLEHFYLPTIIVQQINHVTKNGAYIAVVVPNESTYIFSFLLRMIRPFITKIHHKNIVKEHLTFFTPDSIVKIFGQNFVPVYFFGDSLFWMDWPYTDLLDIINPNLKFIIADKLLPLMKHKATLYITSSMSLLLLKRCQ